MKLMWGVILLICSYVWSHAMIDIWAYSEPWWARAICLVMIFVGEILLIAVGNEINELKEKVARLENKSGV